MPTKPSISWTELFASDRPGDLALTLKVIKKGGESFLILPNSPGLAAKALTLYPAQTNLARIAKKMLGLALLLKLPIGLGKATVQISRDDLFSRFLIDLAEIKSGGFPDLAILAGNARVEGRRFIILIFDEHGEPAFVVKAGLGESARALIQKEKLFLQATPAEIPGLPKIHASFDSDKISAFAMAYVAGDSPKGEPWDTVGDLLQGWIDRKQRVRIETTLMMQALVKKVPAHPAYPRLSTALDGFEVHPVLFHGDFAPWNIKVSAGAWTVLDWERGELIGIPGWDWFHFATQTGILVEKLPVERLFNKLEKLLNDPSFKKYAVAAGIHGREKELLIAYLFYLVEVIRPTEGLESAKALLNLLCERWLP